MVVVVDPLGSAQAHRVQGAEDGGAEQFATDTDFEALDVGTPGQPPRLAGQGGDPGGAEIAAGAWNAAINALVKAGKVKWAGERKGGRYRVG